MEHAQGLKGTYVVLGYNRWLLNYANKMMHPGSICPTAGSLGECPALLSARGHGFSLVLNIWDSNFNDGREVAQWFYDLGATSVNIEHTVHCDVAWVRAGRDIHDGSRMWIVRVELGGAYDHHASCERVVAERTAA